MLPLAIALLAVATPAVPPAPSTAPIDRSTPPQAALEREIPAALRGTSSSGSGMVLALVALGALGAATWLARRRRTSDGRLVRLLETTSLGPKRSLVLASLGGKTLLLGTSEAGITLLAALPRIPEPLEAAKEPAPTPTLRESTRLANLFKPKESREPSFEVCLDETLEDQELRAALARGLGGKVQ